MCQKRHQWSFSSLSLPLPSPPRLSPPLQSSQIHQHSEVWSKIQNKSPAQLLEIKIIIIAPWSPSCTLPSCIPDSAHHRGGFWLPHRNLLCGCFVCCRGSELGCSSDTDILSVQMWEGTIGEWNGYTVYSVRELLKSLLAVLISRAGVLQSVSTRCTDSRHAKTPTKNTDMNKVYAPP